MCDLSPLRNWLIACAVAILAAVAVIVGAAIANGSYWYTYLSPAGMLVAAAFTVAAMGACAMAQSALATFCMCAGPRCNGPCTNMRTTLSAATAVLGIQAVACLTVAAYSWIPGAAQPAQWAIIGALVIQAALIIAAMSFFNDLTNCQRSSAPGGPPTPPTPPTSGGPGTAPT